MEEHSRKVKDIITRLHFIVQARRESSSFFHSPFFSSLFFLSFLSILPLISSTLSVFSSLLLFDYIVFPLHLGIGNYLLAVAYRTRRKRHSVGFYIKVLNLRMTIHS